MRLVLAQLAGGSAGSAAARSARTQNNADVTTKDVYVFFREIAREAEGNPLAVTARHEGPNYSLKSKVDYIQEDVEDYNVSFDISMQGA